MGSGRERPEVAPAVVRSSPGHKETTRGGELNVDGGPALPGLAPALDPAARARLMSQLQRSLGNAAVQRLVGFTSHPPAVQREPTRPRAATGADTIADFGRHTASTGAGTVTAGSLARQEWESLFSRHFVEPDQVEDEVESSHARYLFSRVYGWIDAQHFFAHIQFTEELGAEGATAKGVAIEHRQQQL